jgi:hypothetical protein
MTDRTARGRIARLPLIVAAGAMIGISACVAPPHQQAHVPASQHPSGRSAQVSSKPVMRGPFAVVLDHTAGGRPADVVNMATGRVVAQIRTPVARSDYEWVAAADDDRTFVLADQTFTLIYRFYLLTLAGNGRPEGLRQLPVPALHAAQIYGLALTADGSKLAVAWQNNPSLPPRSRIEVASTSTGQARTWTSTDGAAVDVSWAGDRSVAFGWQDTSRQARSGIRVLNTMERGTSPLASRLLIPASTQVGGFSSPGHPLISQDGSVIFAVLGDARSRKVIVRFSARTGKPLRMLTKPASVLGQSGQLFCGILRADRSGEHALVQCGQAQARIDGNRSTPIQLVPLFQAQIGFANSFAW